MAIYEITADQIRAEFPMNWTYKRAYTRSPLKGAASTRILTPTQTRGGSFEGNAPMLIEFLSRSKKVL